MTRLSNWKEESDLFEVVTGKMTDKEALKKVDEKKGIKNKVVINPKLTETIKNMGGELIEANEEEGNVNPADEAKKKSEEQKKKQIENKQKRAQMIKKQVLMKKLIAVRSGSEDIVAHYKPEGEELKEYSPNVTYQAKGGRKSGKLGKSSVYSLKDKGESKKEFRKSQVKDIKGGYLKTEEVELDERLGGKGYKPYTSLTGKKISGDWEDSDRGAGNKAKKRAGGKVEKKSPTYRAYVLNKEEVEIDEATRYKKEKGYDKGGTKKPSGKKDAALSAVVSMIRSKHGKSAIVGQGSRQQKKVKGAKSTAGTGKYKRAADEKKQLKKDAKEMGYGSDTKGYIETRARYGSKENMKSGRGLGT